MATSVDVENLRTKSWSDLVPDEFECVPAEHVSTEEKVYHSDPLFVLNRNGLSRDELWETFSEIVKRDYPEEDIKVTWVSIFGNLPERPHAFVILSKSSAMDRYREDGEIIYDYQPLIAFNGDSDQEVDDEPRTLNFKVDEVKTIDPEAGFEKTRIYLTGVPTYFEEDEDAKVRLSDFFDPIAQVKNVILPSNWKAKKHAFLEFYDTTSVAVVIRVAKICDMDGQTMYANFARIAPPKEVRNSRDDGARSTSPIPRNGSKSPDANGHIKPSPRVSPKSQQTNGFHKAEVKFDVKAENGHTKTFNDNPYASLCLK
jgi:hypothetical protein